MAVLNSKVRKNLIKSKSVSPDSGIELTIEVRLTSDTTEFVNELVQISGVRSAVLVSYNGDYMSA
jgi:hypothetical protein